MGQNCCRQPRHATPEPWADRPLTFTWAGDKICCTAVSSGFVSQKLEEEYHSKDQRHKLFMAEDPLEDVLNLEEQLYQQGYRDGVADGTQAGKIEGRSFGLEKGFEKFLESGRLYGKSVVWANRLPRQKLPDPTPGVTRATGRGVVPRDDAPAGGCQTSTSLPPLPGNSKLAKNITTLHALVEPESLSTDNTDDAVNDFDDRLRRAQGKVKIIEKMVGEDDESWQTGAAGTGSAPSEEAPVRPLGKASGARDGSW